MPINEIEIHPFLHIGEAIPALRIIVGTFPIYSLTNPRTQRKNSLQQDRNDISFFYGSRSNCFWNWYQQYIDADVNIQNPESIITSLTNKGIAISDVIQECLRITESFEDNKLQQKQWNMQLSKVIESSIDKIVCTSKSDSGAMGWLRDKILIPSGFRVNQLASADLHHEILNNIPDSNHNIKLIAVVLQKADRRVEIVSLPSPGSPQRRLVDFGYVKNIHTTPNYLDDYLTKTFKWFIQ
jgi:hypothetical protein